MNTKAQTSLWQKIFPILVLIAVNLFTWKEVIHGGWINWDDPEYVLQNPYLKNPGQVFSGFYMGNYHPLTLLSLALDYQVWEFKPLGWHLSNLLIHIVSAILLFRIALKTGIESIFACMLAGLWSVLPLHAEPIAWVSSRKDVLYTLFSLGSLLLMFQAVGKEKISAPYYWGSLFLFICACLSKGMAVILPFWMLILIPDIWKNVKKSTAILRISPFLIISLLTGILSILAQQKANAVQMHHSFTKQILFACISLGTQIRHVFFPVQLSAFYPYPSDGLIYETVLSMLLIGLISAGAYLLRKKYPEAGKGFLLFVLALLPVLQILPVGIAITADRYAYLASAGLLLGLMPVFSRVPISSSLKFSMGFCLALTLIWVSRNQIKYWKSGTAVFSRVTDLYPQAAFAWNNLGNAWAENQRPDKALEFYQKSFQTDSMYHPAIQNLILLWSENGRNTEAVQLSETLLRRAPENPEFILLNIQVQKTKADYRKNIIALCKILQNQPRHFQAWFLCGSNFQSLHKYSEALICFAEAEKIQPENKNLKINQAMALAESGKADLAVGILEKIRSDSPNELLVLANLAWAYYRNGNSGKAAEINGQCLKTAPSLAKLWFNQGLFHLKNNNLIQADSAYQEAMQLNPAEEDILQAEKDLEEAGFSRAL